MYAPLFAQLTPEAKEKLLKGNYERLFDKARRDVRAWEKANVRKPVTIAGRRKGGGQPAEFADATRTRRKASDEEVR